MIYNTFLCAKYGVSIAGISEKDVTTAKDLVNKDEKSKKIIELPSIVESETIEGRIEGKYRTISIKDFKRGNKYGYILDIDPESFKDPEVAESISKARERYFDAETKRLGS